MRKRKPAYHRYKTISCAAVLQSFRHLRNKVAGVIRHFNDFQSCRKNHKGNRLVSHSSAHAQTVQVSLESALFQRDYNREDSLQYAAYQNKGPRRYAKSSI